MYLFAVILHPLSTPAMPSLALYIVALLLLAAAVWLLFGWGHLLFYLADYVHIKLSVWNFVRQRRTIVDMFEHRVAHSPNSPAILFEGRTYTYRQLDELSSCVALWALQQQLKPDDVVAILMDNSADYIVTWLGLAKVGVTSALINNNLKGQPLTHSLLVCHCRALIVDQHHTQVVQDIRDTLPATLQLFSHGCPTPGYDDMSATLEQLTAKAVDCNFAVYRQQQSSSSLLFYIFTSGTTGLPKAARIRHSRFYLGSVSFAVFFHLTSADRIYSPLPLYHSVGGILAVGMAWHTGCSLVLRRRFSASSLFQECAEADVTVIMYIGQLCKYLMHTQPSAYESRHRIRIAIGNGMPADVWAAFQRRFHIRDIGEFYASTEGNANLVNNRNRVGAIGYIPWIARLIYPVRIVAFDHSTEQPLRGADGRCIDATEGELIGKVSADPLRAFDGYTNEKATSDKVLTNVYRRGDRWFRTGDLVRQDSDGYIYFVDRIGDTFRWKGENVATTEVERLVQGWPGVKEVNVYGVKVGSNDGKAGMAAIVLHDDRGDVALPGTDFRGLYSYLASQMPAYQQPLFVRLQKEMNMTSTFKLRKVDMVAEGFDPDRVCDPLFFRDDRQRTFVPLDRPLYRDIIEGKVRV